MNVGEKIKGYVVDNGIKLTWLSTKTGISMPKLSLALTGKRRLTFPEYEVICWALGVETDKFLEPRRPIKVS